MARMEGNLINRIYETAKNPKPEIGMGMTEMCWSDRHAFTVVNVINEKLIEIQQDKATRTDSNGMSDAQSYSYEPNPKAPILKLRLNKRGQWKECGQPKGSTYVLGIRMEYYDYSF